MLALGLLFILGAAAVTAGAIYDGGESASFELFGQTIGTTISGVFMAGFATMLVFILGIWMLMSSMSRGRRKRLERKETKARQRESVSQIEQERAQLRAENEQLQERLAREGRPADETATDGVRSTDETSTGPTTADGRPTTTDGRPTTTDGRPTTTDGNDRVVDHTTDLTSRGEEKAASTSARHREI
jgi:ABC-type nickel/cobalt efflux system permease component RcnA